MTLIADFFLRLRPPKIAVTSMSKESPFRLVFEKQHGKLVPTLLKSERKHTIFVPYMYHICWSMWKQLSCKNSVLVICKILSLCFNTLRAVANYSVLNRNNLTQTMQLSKKKNIKKLFHNFFSAFLKSSLNFEHFDKRDEPQSWFISEPTASKERG